MDEKYEMMYSKTVHPQYGEVFVIMIHPNEWDDFKKRTAEIEWQEVTRDTATS